jgi:hypothetical protein
MIQATRISDRVAWIALQFRGKNRHPLRQTRSNVEVLETCNPEELQYNEYDDDNDQNMDPTACLREAWAYVSTEEAEQPQDEQNYDDSPQHEISPF